MTNPTAPATRRRIDLRIVAVVAAILVATIIIVVTMVAINNQQRYDECIALSKTKGSVAEVIWYQETFCR